MLWFVIVEDPPIPLEKEELRSKFFPYFFLPLQGGMAEDEVFFLKKSKNSNFDLLGDLGDIRDYGLKPP